MLFMVVETFCDDRKAAMSQRFQTLGRLLPDKVEYVASWMCTDGNQCFQIMEAPSRDLLDLWISRWSDLVDFDVTEVKTSQDYWNEQSSGKD